jgi:hypothetical protein
MRAVNATLLLILIVALSWFAHAAWLARRYDRGYPVVVRGDSERRVVALLGTPRSVSGPPENVAWDSETSIQKNDGTCVRVFWYPQPLDITGGSWTIGFDKQSRVVSKYHYQSP